MVGPTASELSPCVSRSLRARLAFLALMAGIVMLVPTSAVAQGPGGPIQQVGFGGQGGLVSRHLHPYPAVPCDGGYCPEVTFEYVPTDDDRLQRHFHALGTGARSLWYRLEYLNWTIETFGDYPLGANRLSDNEAGPFDAVDIIAEGFATQPNARAFDFTNNNGIRASVGLPTNVGDFEADIWVLDQVDSAIRQEPVRRFDLLGDPLDNTIPNFFAATVLTVDGALSDTTMLLYDQNYQATLRTDVFGTEFNFVFNPLTPNQPLTIRPIVGFQYLNYRENFLIAGADLRDAMDPNDPTATVLFNHRIDARSQNNVYAPQIGVRAEFVHEWFTISVTPKFLLGLNRRSDELHTAEILALDDGVSRRDLATEVAPGFDLKVESRVHLNEHFSLFAGYQLYVHSNISRPVGNINYDTIGGTIANLSLNTLKQHQLWIDGVTVGGELRFH